MVRVFLLIVAHFLLGSAFAQSGGPFVSVPAGGAPMPHYFYSTNNRVSGNAMVGPADERGPRNFTYAALKIQGYIVKDFFHLPGEPQPMSIGLEAVFDSTVFASGTWVTITFVAFDSYGDEYLDSDMAQVKNRIALAQLDQWNDFEYTDSIEQTNQMMANMGWDIDELSGPLWDPDDLNAHFTGAVIYHLSTDGYWAEVEGFGTYLYHVTDNWDEVFAQQLPSGGVPNYLTWRVLSNGTDYPPRNSTNVPPVTFAFLDACYLGISSEFNTILYPWWTSYGTFAENMAFVGYSDKVRVLGAPGAARSLFNYLSAGYVVDEARELFFRDNIIEWEQGNDYWVVHLGEGQNEDTVVDSNQEMKLWGDPNTRVRWVYTGDESLAEEAWYR